MMKPQIATILDNGEYGQREMTDEEYANYLEMQANAPKPLGEADDASEPS